MSKYTLPFYSDFFHILLNNEIIEWRANDFIKAIFNDKQYVKPTEKQCIYRGLSILVKCNYLLKVRDEDNRNIFRYSESSYLKSYLNVEKLKYFKLVLIEEEKSLENVLERRKTEKVFIEKIISKNPDLQSFFDKYEDVISKELCELENKNSFIVNVFNDIESYELGSM